jgi:hypothetical protein
MDWTTLFIGLLQFLIMICNSPFYFLVHDSDLVVVRPCAHYYYAEAGCNTS